MSTQVSFPKKKKTEPLAHIRDVDVTLISDERENGSRHYIGLKNVKQPRRVRFSNLLIIVHRHGD